MYRFLVESGRVPISHDCTVKGAVCLKYRPDFVYDRGTHIVIVECDENYHEQYDEGCERYRERAISVDFHLPTIFFRVNPNMYTVDGVTRKVDRIIRYRKLLERLEWADKIPFDQLPSIGEPYVEFLYYPESIDANGNYHRVISS